MTEQELRIAKLSKIMNSGLRVKTSDFKAHNEAYSRVITSLEKSLESEKKFNYLQEKKQKLLEQAEREQENLKESIYKHHFKVLQQQIEEKKRSKQIEDKEVVIEKELTEETFKPQGVKIKEMLDQQVEEKKKIKQDLFEKEAAIDKLRLELARKSLESEMRNKSEGKRKLQNQLRESWEKTQNTNKLQKTIDRLRRFGDNYVIDSEEEAEEKNEDRESVMKRYEKLFGKYKEDEGQKESRELTKSIEKKKKGNSENRSKSLISNASKASQVAVMEKINQLKEEEEKIKREKAELMNYLESKNQSKASQRPITVSSLLSKTLDSRGLSKFANN